MNEHDRTPANKLAQLCDAPLPDGRRQGCTNPVKWVCVCARCQRDEPMLACEEHRRAVAVHHHRIYGRGPWWTLNTGGDKP